VRGYYDERERCAETLFFDYYRQHRLQIRVARIFNTYGPRMHPGDGRVVSTFILQALRQEPVTIFGDGRQTRSFCYVDDLIDALYRFMNIDPDFPGPVNLGAPTEITIRELAETIIAMSGSRSKIVSRSLPQDDPARRSPDITLARQLLGLQPATSFNEGLQRTIAYFDELVARLASSHGLV
jgi:UDP-glucuronate decarboxylase